MSYPGAQNVDECNKMEIEPALGQCWKSDIRNTTSTDRFIPIVPEIWGRTWGWKNMEAKIHWAYSFPAKSGRM